MISLKKILWRLTLCPLILCVTPLILLGLFILGMDEDWWDTKLSLFYLWDMAWNGLYLEGNN